MSRAQEILKQIWGYEAFRPMQEEIVDAVVAGHDTLALLPTGGGKSICFQVPALLMDGICIVVSPLIALMKDQVYQLQKRGVKAEAIHAGLSKREIDILLDNCVNDNVKFLYLSPERLKTELFIERLKKIKERRGVGLLAVDEAHCISQWGYDFRPAYLEIAAVRELIPETPVIALTATATPRVKKDIQKQLKFRNTKVFTKSFARPNLSYSVRFEEHKERKLIEVLHRITGTAVVYVSTRKHTKELAYLLQRHHISADFYHAGLSFEERNRKQEDWIHNRTRVIVSTNAFGMGIDKADVRLVVHMDLPQNLEAYYQEAGRAGRDEKKAFALVICHQQDIDQLRKRVTESLPDEKLLREVYQMLGNYYQLAVGSFPEDSMDLEMEAFVKQFDRKPLEIFHALKALESEGLILLSESFYQPSRLGFIVDQRRLYEFQVANVQFDPLIKGLLRLYGGELYQHMSMVKEGSLAALLGTSVNQCRTMLKQMADMELVQYFPQKDKPQLSFLSPRQAVENLSIDTKRLKAKRKLTLEKMEAMISYVHNEQRCRTQQLLEYFGEVSYDRCGVCDNCVSQKQHAGDDARRVHYKKQILALLHQDVGLDLNKLVEVLDPEDKQLFSDLVSELLDHGVLFYDPFGKIKPSR